MIYDFIIVLAIFLFITLWCLIGASHDSNKSILEFIIGKKISENKRIDELENRLKDLEDSVYVFNNND